MTPEEQATRWAMLAPSTWLAGAAGRERYDVVIKWGTGDELVWLPCGIRWNALRMPEWMGLTALRDLLESPAKEALGPVLHAANEEHLYWLLPAEPDTGATWLAIDADLELLGTGQHIACPNPEPETEPDPTQPATWVHLPKITGVLTPPTLLAHVLGELLALEADL